MLLRLVLASSIAVFADSLTPPCPPGWTLVSNKFCYFYSGGLHKTWNGSEEYCNNNGGQLASTYNKTELATVSGLTNGSVYATWVGLYKKGNNWQWADGTSALLYTQWLEGEPMDNSGSCGALRSADPVGYFSVSCQNLQPFICRQYAATCGFYSPNVTANGKGSISSPGYPSKYANNLDCTQFLIAPEGNFISLYFDVWLVEEYYDYVTLYDGYGTIASKRIAKIDTDPTWYNKTFESTSNVMTVHFHTDAVFTEKGWHANFVSLFDSPPVYANGTSGTLTSPNYPNVYNSNTAKFYYINTAFGTQINVTFTDFLVESYDKLYVYDGANDNAANLGNFTGNALPGPFISSANALTLFFKTDSTINYRGWTLNWAIC